MQIGLARDMTARFLPIFRANHPERTPEAMWPETVLGDLGGYYEMHGRAVENEPTDSCGGDMSFRFALCALLDAVSYARREELPRVTPACCTALVAAVGARARNVWHADDPEAVDAFNRRDRQALTGRTMHDNTAANAVRIREWLMVAEWLEERVASREADDSDDGECERWLEWWLEREGNL
ncbi:MAG: hypothetical protein AAGC55_05795 [Myxococcota bacterium]